MMRNIKCKTKKGNIDNYQVTSWRGVRWFGFSEQNLLFALNILGHPDGSSDASNYAESDFEFTFIFHTYFVGEVDFEEWVGCTIFSSLFSLVTGSLSVGGTTSFSR
jgi:hypothetical protein